MSEGQQTTKEDKISVVKIEQEKIHRQINDQIQSGEILIPTQRISFLNHKSEKAKQTSRFQQKMKKISELKNKTLEDLHQLQSEEKNLLKNIKVCRNPRGKVLQRSTYTEQEKESIRSILKYKNRKQKIFQRKHENILQNYLKKLNEDYERQVSIKQQMRHKNKQKALKQHKQLSIRTEQRKQFSKKTNKQYGQAKIRDFLYRQEIRQKQAEQKLKVELERQEKLGKIKIEHKFDSAEISEHSKVYQSHLKEKEEERKFKIKHIKTEQNMPVHFDETKFSRILAEEDNEKRSIEKQKKQQPYLFRKKIKQFGNLIKETYKPSQSKKVQRSLTEIATSRQLSYIEMRKQGNNNLTFAKKHRKEKEQERILTQPKIEKYENYLVQLKKKKAYRTSQQFQRILELDPKQKDYENALKATNLAEQINAKSKKTKDDKLYEAIKNKIEILKVFI